MKVNRRTKNEERLPLSYDVYAVHDRTWNSLRRLTSSLMSLVIEMLGDASIAGSVETDSVNLCG